MNKHKSAIHHRSGKKLFLSVLVTYLVLLAVIIAFLIAGYSYTTHQARSDLEKLEVSFLGQVRRELDVRLNSVSQISRFLATHPLTQSIAQYEDEKVNYQLDYRALDEAILEQNSLLIGEGSTIVYFDSSDSILTGEYRYRSVNIDAYAKRLNMTAEEFRAFLPQRVTQGEMRILHPGEPNTELVYLTSIVDSDFQKTGTVLTRISMSYLKKTVNADHWLNGSICCIQNGDERLYIDGGGYDDTIILSEAPEYSQINLNAQPVATKIHGKRYLTVGLPSMINTLNYFFSIPMDKLEQTHAVYLTWFILLAGLALFSGVLLSLYFSRRLTSPIEKILDALKLDSSVNYAKAVASLEEALGSYKKEISAEQRQKQREELQKKAGFVYGLCTGRVQADRLSEGIERYDLPLKEGPVSLIVFQYYDVTQSVFIQEGHLDHEMMSFSSCNVIEEMLCRNCGVAVGHEKEIICLLQGELQQNEDSILEILKAIYDFHKNVFHVGIRIYCPGQVESFADLPERLSVAEEMSNYKVFWDDDVPDILFYSDYSDMGGQDQPGSPGAEKRFLNFLAIENYEEAYRVMMDHLNLGISKDMKRFQMERYRIHGYISNLIDSLSPRASEQDMEDLDTALNDLLTEKTLGGLREKVEGIFKRLIYIQKNRNQLANTPSWVQDVQKYIEEHYAEPQMDVTHLAKTFSINISHLSRTFKKTTSIGVLDDIHMTRISKAKELLKYGCTVQEASQRVGYLESRALIRAFKRYEGITPGQYQEISQN